MRVATNIGEAFLNAALQQAKKDGVAHKPHDSKNWVARSIIDKAVHTTAGTKEVKPIDVHVSKRTADAIAVQQRIDVWK